MNFHIDKDGAKFSSNGPDIGLLARLDHMVSLSLETSLAPFVIEEVMRPAWVVAENVFDPQNSACLPTYFKRASPNRWSPNTEKLGLLLARDLHALWSLDPASPAAKQLLYAPHLQLLVEMFFRHPVQKCRGQNISLHFRNTERLEADVYNDFVAQFRQAMLARKLLRRERHNWSLGSRENVENLRAYLDDLFTRHHSLTVLHLRLFHARERINLITAPVDEQHQDLQALRACRAKFFDRMRRKPALFTDAPGYVWAVLPSLEGGYDLHLTLLVDTASLRGVLDDKRAEAEQIGAALEDYSDQVGGYWVTGGTGGRGGYIRGDRSPGLYGPDWVHGEVCADDPVRRKKLRETLDYLALRRVLVRLKNEPSGAYFGMPDREARPSRRLAKRGAQERESSADTAKHTRQNSIQYA
ncbi:hypothetical protein [Paraburkholderia sp. GAS32]|uniref:hypothetical protein n=1 Tax=Paraburkholderia sp. GAS32 TaxID=3035129 RepID=UPI003D1D59F5